MIKKFPVFLHKIKTKTYIKILRHYFLQMNVIIIPVRLWKCASNIKGEIMDQKIKVKISVFNSFPRKCVSDLILTSMV